jgi:hypothetical protein
MKKAKLTKAQTTAICVNALADLFERDCAELTRTKQSGHEKVCADLKVAVEEIRTEFPLRRKATRQ